MSYVDELAKISRIPCQYVRISFNECANTFGSPPCLATGDPCYNTYPTCKNKANYNITERQYHFTSHDAPLPFRTNERPYVKKVKSLPIEIKEEITVNQRMYVDMYDEPDYDITETQNAWLLTEAGEGIITESGTALAGEGLSGYSTKYRSYWKKLLARHTDWYNRTIECYEGFSVATNLSTSNFKRTFLGKIKNIQLSGNEVKIEAVDNLANLNDVYYPAPTKDVTLKVANDVSANLWNIKVNNPQNLSTGYLAIGKEIVNADVISTVTGRITLNSRGDFLTPSTDHGKGAVVQQCGWITPQNPFDIMLKLLTSAANIPSSSVDTAAFVAMKSWPGRECYFTQIIPEPKPISDLYYDLLKITGCYSWIDENQQITIGRQFLKNSTSPWGEISDSANIIQQGEKVELDANNAITQVTLNWDWYIDPTPYQGKKWKKIFPKSTSGYARSAMYTDTFAESTAMYGQRFDETIETLWLHTSNSYPSSDVGGYDPGSAAPSTYLYHPDVVADYANNFAKRYVLWRSQGKRIYDVDLELKDATFAVGEQILVSGDIMLDSSGDPLNKVPCMIKKKETKDNWNQSLQLEDYGARVALIAPDSQVDYTSALSSQIEYGFISDTCGYMSNGDKGYVIY